MLLPPLNLVMRFYDQHRSGRLEKKMAAFHVGTIVYILYYKMARVEMH